MLMLNFLATVMGTKSLNYLILVILPLISVHKHCQLKLINKDLCQDTVRNKMSDLDTLTALFYTNHLKCFYGRVLPWLLRSIDDLQNRPFI